MSVGPCKYCEHDVARNAKRCPHCGGKRPYSPRPGDSNGGATIVLLTMVVVFVVINLVRNSNDDQREDDRPSEAQRPMIETSRAEAQRLAAENKSKQEQPDQSRTKLVEDGRDLHQRILSKHRQLDEIYRGPTLYGALTSDPLALIHVPVDEWEQLSSDERAQLEAYAASMVSVVKAHPFQYSGISSAAPAAAQIRQNVSRMDVSSWGIMEGRMSNDGVDIYSDRIAVSGK